MGYLRQTVSGTTWVGGFRVASRLVAFVKLGVIARLLTPDQFGVYGIATIILAFLEIFTETGVNTVLIQTKERIHKYINTAWCVSILRGMFMSLVIFLTSGLVSQFFDNSEAKILLRLISVVPLIRGFINPSVVIFQKELLFKKEFWFRLVVFSTDALAAVLLVLVYRSPQGLIGGFIVGAVVELLLSFIISKPRPRLIFSKMRWNEIISKGKWVTGSRISEYLFSQGDDIVVGKLLDVGSLGLYQAAYKLSTLPVSEVADVIGKVTFPVFSKISEDNQRLKSAFYKSFIVSLTVAFGLGFFIYVFSEQLILILLGNNWLSVEPLLKVLLIFGVIKASTTSLYSLFLSLGRQDIVTKITSVNTVFLAIIVIPAIAMYGLMGAPYAVVVASLVGLPYGLAMQHKLLSK